MLFLKLGGSLITDKRRRATARRDVIRRMAREVSEALAGSDDLSLVVGHGSGSFGHYAAEQFNFSYREQASFEGFYEIGAAAARLNRIVVDSFLEEGVPVFPVQPSATAQAREGDVVRMDDAAIREVLAQRGVPVVYGDVCLDEAWGWTILSTEQILAYLSHSLKPERIILAGEVGGVHSEDPARDAEARLIPEITPAGFGEVRSGLQGADGYDVTGGMLSKVESMLALVEAQPGLEVHLISGMEAGQVGAALRGEPVADSTVIRHG